MLPAKTTRGGEQGTFWDDLRTAPNAFSKKAENHAHAVSLFFLYYNYCRPHQTLTKAAQGVKTTPAMASGLTDRVWTIQDVVGLMDPALARVG